MFGGLGTTGVEIGVAERVGGAAGLRMSAEFLKVGRNFESDGATYDTKLKFSSLGLYGDYFITGGGFRLSAGAVIGTRKATGNAVATNGTLSINGSSYPAAGESVGAEAKFPSAAPYIGIGYGKIDPKDVLDVLAPPSMDGKESVPPEQLREGRIAGFVRKVIKGDDGGVQATCNPPGFLCVLCGYIFPS